MKQKSKIKFFLISSLMCLSTDYAFAVTQSHTDTNSLSSNVEGLKAASTKLTPHDSTMKDLILTHEEKNAVLKNIDKVLREKNKVIFEYMKLTKSLNSKVNELSLSQRLKVEFKKRKLSTNIEGQEDTISDLKAKIEEKTLRINYLKKIVKNQNTQLTQKINKLNFRIKNLSESLNVLPEEMEKMAFISESKHIEEIRNLQNQLHTKSMKIISYQDQLEKYEDLSDISDTNNQLAIQLKSSNEQLQQYKISFEEVQMKLIKEKEKNKKLIAYTENIEKEYSNHIQILESKYSEAIALVKSSNSKPTRMPASVPEMKVVISKVDLGYLVEIDPRHLKIILDERFFFKSGNTNLSISSKEKLQSIMTSYSNEIFSKEELKDRLENIHVIGHSSPVYKSKIINPLAATQEAYKANMDISLNRAKSIVEAIISENTNLPHREEIRSKLIVSGKSFTDPVPLTRGIASSGKRPCGEYDCEASQRVEIIFELQKKN